MFLFLSLLIFMCIHKFSFFSITDLKWIMKHTYMLWPMNNRNIQKYLHGSHANVNVLGHIREKIFEFLYILAAFLFIHFLIFSFTWEVSTELQFYISMYMKITIYLHDIFPYYTLRGFH